jgi:hypothetical protein
MNTPFPIVTRIMLEVGATASPLQIYASALHHAPTEQDARAIVEDLTEDFNSIEPIDGGSRYVS